MKLFEKNLRLPDIEDLNLALSHISAMVIDPEINMDLGLIHSDIKKIVDQGEKVKRSISLQVLNDLGIEEEDKLSGFKLQKINAKIADELEKFDNSKTYKVEVPVFTKQELKKLALRDKDNESVRAFKPTSIFYTFMKKFIVDSYDNFDLNYSSEDSVKLPSLFEEVEN